jgi:Tol biopolymer transport system component
MQFQDREDLIKVALLVLLFGLMIAGCNPSREADVVMEGSGAVEEGVGATPTPEVVILVPTFTPTGTGTPPLRTQSTPTLSLAIAVPTFTPESGKATNIYSAPSESPEGPMPTDNPFYPLGDTDVIVYASNKQANRDIYIAMIRRELHWPRTETRLTDYYGEDTLPDLSPDGRKVAFVSDRSGNRDVYILDIMTRRLNRLTYHHAEDSNPAWSPDDSKIAFQSNRDGNNEIYIIDVRCATLPEGCPEEVVRITDGIYDDLEPEWSPDGQQIAFMSARSGNLEIFVMNADGSDVTQLTDNPGVDGFPSWSPDGSMLAFHSERDGNTDIYIMTLDGEQEWRVTTSSSEQLAPYWCGNSIVFMWEGVNYDLVIVDVSPEGPEMYTMTLLRSGTSSAFDGFPSCGRPGFNTSSFFPEED